jgi:hypothetical protein
VDRTAPKSNAFVHTLVLSRTLIKSFAFAVGICAADVTWRATKFEIELDLFGNCSKTQVDLLFN